MKELDDNPKAVKKKVPMLEDFIEQIDHYELLYEEVKQVCDTRIFQGWFSVDISPFKTTLLTNIRKWGYIFKSHLLNSMVDSLQELDVFIEKANNRLQAQLHEGDYDGLVKMMEILKLVRDRQRETDSMFEPLQEIVSALRKFGVVIPEVSLVQLTELPEKWVNTKRLSVSAKQMSAALQTMEVGKLEENIEKYEKLQRQFRSRYTLKKIFFYDCQTPYSYLSQANTELETLEAQVTELQSEAGLFEVTVPKFLLTSQCRRDNKMMKQLWDYICLVRHSIDDWKTTLWHNINVEDMDMECKKFSKDLRAFDKEMREWNTFKGLDTTVRNMLTSLRAVGELQNKAIRERHWEQLVLATKVRFNMSDQTSLADLLALNLHNHEDEVHNIVDKALKEMAMEKMLRDLKETWTGMIFHNDEHKRTGNDSVGNEPLEGVNQKWLTQPKPS